MLCSRSSSLIHPFRISKSIRLRISPTPLLIPRLSRSVFKMATTEKTESTPNPSPIKLSDLKKEAKVLEDYLNLASVASVHSHQPTSEGPISFTFTYSQRKLAANGKRSVVLSSTLSDPLNLNSFGPVSLPFETQDALIYSPAPSRRQTFLARAGDTPDSIVLEIWEGPKCLKRLQVPTTLHGSVLNDGLFSGGASWSNDESKIAYVAESPPNEGLPDWGKDTEEESETKLTSKTWKGIGHWDQSWGEGLAKIKRPSIFVFDLKTCSILSFKNLMNDSSLGQPVWTPNDTGLVCVKWPHFQSNFNDVALKLGYLHCKNRPCSLHYIPLEASSYDSKNDLCLSPNLKSACIPSFSPNGKTLVFFSHEHAVETGIHASVSRLYTIDWAQVKLKLEDKNLDLAEYTKLVIGDVARPLPPLNFPGLIPLKDNPMSSPFLDNDQIILSCEWGFQAVIISIKLSTGEITALSPTGMTNETYNLLCFKSGIIIASRSSLTSAPRLVARRINNDDDDSPWTELDKSLQPQIESIVHEALESLEQHEIKFQPKNYPNGIPESPVLCEAVVVRRKDAEKAQPTMLIPHGGPHSAILQGYNPLVALLCSSGITVLTVNFRGSTNYGTDFIMALPGHIGTVDVEDCMQALDESIEKGYTDKNKVCVSGGSHGGFLSGHLVGQFPDRFQCAILRNPALTLGHMVYTTDIPDWVFVETFGPKGKELFTTLPESEILQKFHEKSATRYVEQVKSPMLFLLGALDYRVPHSDALRYISTLKSRKDHPEVRVVVFPNDRHSLDSPQTEFESAMNIIWWLKKHGMIE